MLSLSHNRRIRSTYRHRFLFLFFSPLIVALGCEREVDKAAAGDPIEITFYQRGYIQGGMGAATRLTDAAVAAFEQRRPGVKVRVVGVPWGREGDLKLRTAFLARRRIDCFRLAHDQLPAFMPRDRDMLSPIETHLTRADRRDFSPATLEAVNHRGRLMAWPLWSTAVAIVANPDILERRGIAPPVDRPWTWTEFVAALERATHTDAAGRPVWGLNAAARPPLFEWSPLLALHCGPLFGEGEGDRASEEQGSELELAAGLEGALEEVVGLRRRGLLAPSFGTDYLHEAHNSFIDGRVAFLLTSPGLIHKLRGKGVPFRVLPPPVGRWGKPITTGAVGCFAVVASGDSRRETAAHGLARYLTSAEIAEDVEGWYLATPARRSARVGGDGGRSASRDPGDRALLDPARADRLHGNHVHPASPSRRPRSAHARAGARGDPIRRPPPDGVVRPPLFPAPDQRMGHVLEW